MGTLNVANRTLAVMDNYPFLRSLNNECVDLIAIDPPFAANETFTSPPRPAITQAEFDEEVELAAAHGAAHNEGIGETRVQDFWNWDEDIHPAWKMRIQDDYPSVHAVIEAAEACATENEAAYICFMAVRLIECHRVLKPTGSIYVHCDDRANSYLRLLLDAVFGPENLRNQIVWRRATAHNDPSRFGRILDHILYYSKSADYVWNGHDLASPKTAEEIRASYPSTDERGRYRSSDLTGAGGTSGKSGEPWGNYSVTDRGRHWSVPITGRYAEYIEQNFIPGYRGIEDIHERLDALDRAGLIHHPQRGRWPGLKRYADADSGNPPQNLILEPIGFTNFSAQRGEYTGYSTQKPLGLYERLVRASSNPGDVVMDVFAGCATTAIAAESLERQWITCDMAYRAWTMLKRRFYLNGIALEGMTDSTREALASARRDRGFQEPQQWTSSYVIGPNELPRRDDADPATPHELEQARRSAQSTQSSTWSGRISKDEAKALLIEQFGPVCWGCGYEPRRPNGSLDATLLEVDHIRARRATEGVAGDDELYNLALLHRTCNGIKRNRLTLEELRCYNADNGLLYVNTVGELVDLFEATRFAAQEISRRGVFSEE